MQSDRAVRILSADAWTTLANCTGEGDGSTSIPTSGAHSQLQGLAACAMFAGPHAAEPTAAGLWQKVENNKRIVWDWWLTMAAAYSKARSERFGPDDGRATTSAASASMTGRSSRCWASRPSQHAAAGRNTKTATFSIRAMAGLQGKMSVSAGDQALTVRGYWGVRCSARTRHGTHLPDTEMASLDPTVIAKYVPTLAAAAIKPPTVSNAAAKAPVARR